jgi:muramoyltetrapeptide carboxypeptidase LdcA involved in peptidoglycan recycling
MDRFRGRSARGETQVNVTGRVLGGCLDTLMHLVGTRYGDVPGFVQAAGDEGCLLFLENCELSPVALVRALTHLRYAGWFDGIRALVLGRSNGPHATGEGQLTYAEAVGQSLARLGCPVLVDADFGHVPPQITLIQGALGELRFSAGERARFTQTLV